jgi:hypothetical protein
MGDANVLDRRPAPVSPAELHSSKVSPTADQNVRWGAQAESLCSCRGRRPRLQHRSAHDPKCNAGINYQPFQERRLRMWLVLAAMLRLDGKMNQFFVLSEQLAVFIRASWFMRNDRDDGGELSGSNLPHV